MPLTRKPGTYARLAIADRKVMHATRNRTYKFPFIPIVIQKDSCNQFSRFTNTFHYCPCFYKQLFPRPTPLATSISTSLHFSYTSHRGARHIPPCHILYPTIKNPNNNNHRNVSLKLPATPDSRSPPIKETVVAPSPRHTSHQLPKLIRVQNLSQFFAFLHRLIISTTRSSTLLSLSPVCQR